MAAGEGADVEGLWAKALQLSEGGEVHEAILHFECASAELERQLAAAASVPNADRVRSLLGELLAKLGSEVELHLNYLRGNHWVALALEPPAGDDAVKKAYRRLALRYHPDKSRVSPKIFTIVGKAHEVLRHPERRKRYKPDKSATAWKVGELKERLKFFGVPATGERRDLEADLIRAAALKPRTPPSAAAVGAELRASSPATCARRGPQRGDAAGAPRARGPRRAAPGPRRARDRRRRVRVSRARRARLPRSPDAKRAPDFAAPAKADRPSFDERPAASPEPAAPAPAEPKASAAPERARRRARASPRRHRASPWAAAPAAPYDDGDASDDSGLLPAAGGFVGSRARASASSGRREPAVGPVHVAAAREGGDVQSESTSGPGARTHATPASARRRRGGRRASAAARGAGPGLVDPGGGWFWG
ncbi:N-acetyl-beta-D-galactosaminidase [Aureococcus anophagefferens]|nr:N-acetyl-beta-D-galactosaminidase [Aureococcus anophagefferens]